jgi:transposase InsO family protein
LRIRHQPKAEEQGRGDDAKRGFISRHSFFPLFPLLVSQTCQELSKAVEPIRFVSGVTEKSMVGRILTTLKARGGLREPPRYAISARRPPRPRPYALRKPQGYRVQAPGDLVQVDTLDVRPERGLGFKQFTARDVLSRWDVVEAHAKATATTAAGFLTSLQQRMPFRIRALPVDGGSEFAAAFEAACQQRGLRLFVLPPRSPKLNGRVERAQRTHTEEFYEVTPCAPELTAVNRKLQAWERIYNTVRPHQALGYLTPQEFLRQQRARRGQMECH